MQIGLLPKIHAKRPARQAPGAPSPSDVEKLDTFETTQAVTSSIGYKFHKIKAKILRSAGSGLSDQPKAKLQRPLVCVQGFRSKPGGFTPLLDHLTQDGENGGRAYYVKGGEFFADAACEQAIAKDFQDPEAKVFRIVPHERMQSFDVTADQLDVELEAIKKFSGQETVDVLAHSMGGLSVRRYLDKHAGKLGKLMMVGTPHNGTKNAAFARKVIAHNVGWAMSIGGLTQFAAPAVEIMRSVAEAPDANPFLEEMNARWPQQEAKTEGALTIGASGFLTPTFENKSGWGAGDGLVEESAVKLAGAKVKILQGGGTKVHHTLPTDDEVYGEMLEFFAWEQKA